MAEIGNNNAARGKLWREALLRCLETKAVELGLNHRNAVLDRIAMCAIEHGLNAEKWAIEHVADRLDGKPAQEHVGDPDRPLQMVNKVTRTIVDPRHPDGTGVPPVT